MRAPVRLEGAEEPVQGTRRHRGDLRGPVALPEVHVAGGAVRQLDAFTLAAAAERGLLPVKLVHGAPPQRLYITC